MVDVLKPCPFCGGEAIICGNNEYTNRKWVMCKACHACPSGDVPSLAVAVAAWNRRSTLSDEVAEREAEPVAWQRRRKYESVWGEVPQWEQCSGNESNDQFKRSPYHEYRPLYTSPPTSELEALRKRVAELEKALEPFARHIDEMKFDIDNKGNPLPDDQAVGWVYVKNGDFRAASRVREGGKANG